MKVQEREQNKRVQQEKYGGEDKGQNRKKHRIGKRADKDRDRVRKRIDQEAE